MWWHSGPWFWWWLAFLLIFFVLPVGYGWGYRGWGPWYRRRPIDRRSPMNGGTAYVPERRMQVRAGYAGEGWNDGSGVLWLVLIVAAMWLVVALFAV